MYHFCHPCFKKEINENIFPIVFGYLLKCFNFIFVFLSFFQMYLTSKWILCCCWLIFVQLTITIVIACRVSEYPCKGSTSICIPLDKYCDGKADCEDGSDEPRHCTGKLELNQKEFLKKSVEKLLWRMKKKVESFSWI